MFKATVIRIVIITPILADFILIVFTSGASMKL